MSWNVQRKWCLFLFGSLGLVLLFIFHNVYMPEFMKESSYVYTPETPQVMPVGFDQKGIYKAYTFVDLKAHAKKISLESPKIEEKVKFFGTLLAGITDIPTSSCGTVYPLYDNSSIHSKWTTGPGPIWKWPGEPLLCVQNPRINERLQRTIDARCDPGHPCHFLISGTLRTGQVSRETLWKRMSAWGRPELVSYIEADGVQIIYDKDHQRNRELETLGVIGEAVFKVWLSLR